LSDREPTDRFDQEWPHALSKELGRVPLPPRPAAGRYAARRRRRQGTAGVRAWPTAAMASLVVAVIVVTSVAIHGVGRLPFEARHGLASTPHVKQETNGALRPPTPSPIQPSLAPIEVAPVGTYSFAWKGSPTAPQGWTPAAVNDWDLLATSDYPSDQGGTMQARYGADCAPPPATHPVKALADSAFICRDRLMTAINGGGDAPKTYGGVYLAPAQLADFAVGASSITWQVSARRSSANDWWDVWLTPLDENLVAPVGPEEVPAFNGAPADAIHIRMNNGTCPGSGQPATLGTTNGVPIGTVFDVEVFANHKPTRIDGQGFQPCLESGLGRGAADAQASFQLDVAQNHVRFVALRAGGGAPLVYADARVDLPFKQAVVQFAHHSFDPTQACGGNGTCGPNTYQWSNVSINPAKPFTMLRPQGAAAVHGQSATLQLPQPAPANAHLRFYAFGSTRVGFDGHPAQAAAPQQGQQGSSGEASYWTPVPAGTTSITLTGSGSNGQRWWVFDTSVWAP
jgi:hypothetical protein